MSVFGTVNPTASFGDPVSLYTLDDALPIRNTAPVVNVTTYNQMFFKSPELADTEHTLVVTMASTDGASLFLDYLSYTPSPATSSSSGGTNSTASGGDSSDHDHGFHGGGGGGGGHGSGHGGHGSGLSTGVIVGILIASIAVLLVLIVVILLWWRRWRAVLPANTKHDAEKSAGEEPRPASEFRVSPFRDSSFVPAENPFATPANTIHAARGGLPHPEYTDRKAPLPPESEPHETASPSTSSHTMTTAALSGIAPSAQSNNPPPALRSIPPSALGSLSIPPSAQSSIPPSAQSPARQPQPQPQPQALRRLPSSPASTRRAAASTPPPALPALVAPVAVPPAPPSVSDAGATVGDGQFVGGAPESTARHALDSGVRLDTAALTRSNTATTELPPMYSAV